MLTSIEKRARLHDTGGFVTFLTVDVLARKMIGIVGDRRMTLMRRYLGNHGGTPDIVTGLRLSHRGFADPITHRLGERVGVQVVNNRTHEGFGFSVNSPRDTEDEVYERYHHPEKHWLGRREDITSVTLRGWPGGPSATDRITIEHWNENGVGRETIIVFDDIDLLEEVAWDVKGDPQREVHMWDEFCTVCGLHFEHHLHKRTGACEGRPPTRGETLAALAANALKAEAEAAKPS